MFGMTTHNENFMEVREELLHLIVDEDTRTILEAIIWKMNEVGDGSERIKQWCEEAQTYIPADSKYDELVFCFDCRRSTTGSRQTVCRVAETQRKEVR